jgi:hypothetical protein
MTQTLHDPLTMSRLEQVRFTVIALWQGCSSVNFLMQILLDINSFSTRDRREQYPVCYETEDTLHTMKIISFSLTGLYLGGNSERC